MGWCCTAVAGCSERPASPVAGRTVDRITRTRAPLVCHDGPSPQKPGRPRVRPPARRAGRPGRRPRRRRRPGHRVLRRPSRPDGRGAAGCLRHLGAPRVRLRRGVQRRPHRRHDPGDLRSPGGRRDRRPAVPRPRHPRPERAGVDHGARGAGRQRRPRPDRLGGRVHPHALAVARDPRSQPGPRRRRPSTRGWRRRHALAQPAARRWLQVQPAGRRSRGGRHHRAGPGRRERVPGRPPGRRAPHHSRAGDGGRHHRAPRLPRRVRRRPARGRRSRRHPIRRDPDRRRSAGRRERGLLGRHRRPARPRPHRRQPARRPRLALHDLGLGRPDPDGLLVAVRDGVADRTP